MAALDEVSIHSVIERFNERGQRIDSALCAKLAIECCEAVRRAPDPKGPKVRRVIRPETLMLSHDGYVRLAVTYWGECDLEGQFAYLSPEGASGLDSDQRSDVFIIGIILWELLTAKRLFDAATDYQTVELVRRAFVPALNEVDPELEMILGTAAAEVAADRYPSLAELGHALTRYLTSATGHCTHDLRALL